MEDKKGNSNLIDREDNVILFNRSEKTLLSVAEEKISNGELYDALSILLDVEQAGNCDYTLLGKIARLYMDLSLYTQATDYWFKFLDVAPLDRKVEAYNGLGGCYYLAEFYPLSLYYYNLQINDKYDTDLPYDDFMSEMSYEEITAPKISLVDRQGEIDEEKIKLAKRTFKTSNLKAIKILKTIKSDSSKYCDAQNLIAMFNLFLENYKTAIFHFKKALSGNEGARTCALNNLFALNLLLGKSEEVDKYYSAILKEDCASYHVLSKYFYLFCAKDLHSLNFEYVQKVDSLIDSNSEMLVALGCSAYNNNNFELAKRHFLNYHKINRNALSNFYLNAAIKAGECKVKRPRCLEFEFVLPVRECNKLSTKANKYMNMPIELLRKRTDAIIEFAYATVCANRMDLQTVACQLLSFIKNEKSINCLKSLLLKPTVRDNVKSMIITVLVEIATVGEIGMTFGNIYLKIPFEKVRFYDGINTDLFNFAYAVAFGKLAPIFEESITKLKVGAFEVYNKLKSNEKVRDITDPLSMAAVFALISDLKPNDSDEQLIEYFGADINNVDYIISLINAEK